MVRRLAAQSGFPCWGSSLTSRSLGLFKYADFFRGTVFGLLGEDWHPWDLILPLGISFFVFQKISYLIDLRRGDRHIYGFLDFCMFVMFFPQLIAGPLVRHNEIIHQFDLDPRRDGDVGEPVARLHPVHYRRGEKGHASPTRWRWPPIRCSPRRSARRSPPPRPGPPPAPTRLQIYFDFAGYSDMAIGLALMFGLRIPFNFNAPYRALSVRDFWRRWHMTLSRFLRDYLYIPLGGNRCGPARQAANVVATMLLGGLWHGANWTFVAWGGLHGAALAVNHVWESRGCAPAPSVRPGLDAAVRDLRLGAVPLAGFHPCRAGAGQHGRSARSGTHPAGSRIRRWRWLSASPSQPWVRPARKPPCAGCGRETWLAVPAGAALAYLLLLVGGRLPNVFIYFQF